jgi:hypothetical protein
LEGGKAALANPRERSAEHTEIAELKRKVGQLERALGGGLDEMIISLYAGGMTVRDIRHHLARTLGTELSHDTISKITDTVLEEVKAWQARPLEELYPIVYLDALVVKVRDGHTVRNKAAHLAIGSIWTGSSTSWGSGCKPPRGRSSGPGCALSCVTAASAMCSSSTAGVLGRPPAHATRQFHDRQQSRHGKPWLRPGPLPTPHAATGVRSVRWRRKQGPLRFLRPCCETTSEASH